MHPMLEMGLKRVEVEADDKAIVEHRLNSFNFLNAAAPCTSATSS
jgi:hypothetical protein